MKLVEEGRLSLTNSAFDVLQYPTPMYPGSTNDPRLGRITVEHLLNHTAGWDVYYARNPNGGSPFDPAAWFRKPALDLGLQSPLTTSNLVEWIMGLPLQFSPGTDYEYSNVGYLVLGRVIEKITDQPYQEYARDVLKTIGVIRTRVTADTAETLYRGQVMNYDYPRALGNPVVASWGQEVPPNDDPMPYSVRFSMQDSMGGWITSPIEYLRFVTAIDGRPVPPDILSAATINLMVTATAQSVSGGESYGMGWKINSPGPGDYSHGGSDAGTRSKMFRLANGITVMYVVNFNPRLDGSFESFMDTVVTGALGSITAWPTNDFFATTLSYDAWRDRHFSAAELADSAISGDHANPDGDDAVNVLEYATGSDPKLSDNNHAPTGSFVTVEGQSYFALTFRRLLLGYELNYVVEASNDLLAWSPLTEPVGSPQLNPDGTHTVTIRDTAPANTTSHRYLRLRVSRQ